MPVDEKIVPESSPETPEPVTGQETQENAGSDAPEEKALTDREVREYLKKGKLPEKPKDQTESAPPEEQPQPEAESAPADKPDKAKGADARKAQLTAEIKRLADQKRQAAAEFEALQRQIAEAKNPPKDEPKQPEPPKRPKLADFDTYEAYEDALDKYIETRSTKAAEERVTEALKARDEAQTKAEQERAAKERLDRWNQRVTDLGVEDFNEVVYENPTLPVTDLMREAILELEHGPKVAYHLGKNPAEAARIAALPSIRVVAELAKLEARLEAPEKPTLGEPGATRPKISKAAPPVRELGVSQAPVDELDALEERAAAGDAEATRQWMRLRNERERAANRR